MLDLTRCGVLIGSGIGGLGTIANNNEALLTAGVKKVSPFFVPGGIINMASGKISMQYGLKGPNLSIATACTSGLHSIGIAAKMIAYGEADLIVAGGAEAAVTPIGIAGFSAARALSKRNDVPEAASRPWDKDRDGFVLADGAGILIIEEMQHAINREATVLAELIGFGMSSDAYHMTSPPEDGAGAKLAMENALKSAAIETSQIDYINAHGTSTIAGDIAEATAIKNLYADQPCTVPVSSSKSMTGHLIGAAGAVESIFSILAIKHNMMPPTINIDHQDDQCDLDFIAEGVGRAKSINVAMCNSFGFGGTNASLIFRSV